MPKTNKKQESKPTTTIEETLYEFNIPGRNDAILVKKIEDGVLRDVVANFTAAALVSANERGRLDDEAIALLIDQRMQDKRRMKRAWSKAARDVVEWMWREGFIILATNQVALARTILASKGELLGDDQHLRTVTLMRFLLPEQIIISGVKQRNPTPEMLVDFMFYLATQSDEESGFDEYAAEVIEQHADEVLDG